jgi:hypothetical protein
MRTIRNNITIILAVIACSGCTAAQMQSQRMQRTAAETAKASDDCMVQVDIKPEYDILARKMPLNGNHVSLEMLSDKSRANKQEIKVISNYLRDLQACRSVAISGYSKVHPSAGAILVQSANEIDKNYTNLANGNITWGEFNQKSKDLIQLISRVDNKRHD